MVFSFINKSPDFLIIGAQKCGTTSLFHYLSQHPNIDLPNTKEIHFFDNNYLLGIDWYINHFPKKNSLRKKLTGEASPYYLFHPLVPERVKKNFPKVKLIVMLRNPIDRAFSHFMHERRLNFEPIRSFEGAVKMEHSRIDNEEQKLREGKIGHSHAFQHFSYINRGMYFKQISHWLQFFPKNKMHFLKSEDFFSNPEKGLSDVFNFLGVQEIFPKDLKAQNTNKYQKIPDKTKRLFATTFSKDGEQLIALLGDKFTWK